MLGILFRNSDSGIRNFQIEILVIRIQLNMNPAVLPVILDCIFNQIGKRKRKFHFIHLCRNRAKALIHQFHILACRQRTQPFQNPLHQLVDILALHVQAGAFFVHLNQFQKIIDDFIFPLNLF